MNTNVINLKINYEDVLVRMGANKYITKIDSKIKTSILEIDKYELLELYAILPYTLKLSHAASIFLNSKLCFFLSLL